MLHKCGPLLRFFPLSRSFAERPKHQLARRERRFAVSNDMHERLLEVIEARAADPELAGAVR